MRFLLVALVICPGLLRAQFLWRPFKEAVTGPFHWEESQWNAAVGVGLTAAIAFGFDAEINRGLRAHPSASQDFLSHNVFEPWGRGVYAGLLVGGLYSSAWLGENKRHLQFANQLVEGYLLAAGAAQLLKVTFNRSRPSEDQGPYAFYQGTVFNTAFRSMPSGHTAVAFAFARIIHHNTSSRWISYSAHALALGTAWSRMYDNRHWASDVLVGAALGWWIGEVVAGKQVQISLAPSGTGLGVVWQF